MMYPESEHVLDWYHVTMRMMVLLQCAKGLVHSDPEPGKEMTEELESAGVYEVDSGGGIGLFHGIKAPQALR